jgi:hypothetical protein
MSKFKVGDLIQYNWTHWSDAYEPTFRVCDGDLGIVVRTNLFKTTRDEGPKAIVEVLKKDRILVHFQRIGKVKTVYEEDCEIVE